MNDKVELNTLLLPKTRNVAAIDVGSEICGVSLILSDNIVGFNIENTQIVPQITEFLKYKPLEVVIEDVAPYNKRISKDIINTCKFIGELEYRFKQELNICYNLIYRNKVRKWVFERFNDLSVEKIDKKIAYLDNYGEKNNKRRYRNKDGDLRKASFHYVDDRIIIEAMKRLWNIETPKPGQKNKYGLTSHAWQALALGSYYLECAEFDK